MSEEDVILAGELALGVLDGDDRAAALRRVLADPAFAAQVTRWRTHLAVLTAAVPDAEPSAGTERAIERRLFEAAGADRRVVGRWRFAAVAASAVAACLALVAVWPTRTAPPARPMPARILVAALAGEGGKPFNAVYDAAAARIAVIGAAPWPADRSAELWVIAPGAPPRALGLLARGQRSAVTVPGDERAAIGAGATLAVSIEPVGGSPTGLPTGPVVASGGLVSG